MTLRRLACCLDLSSWAALMTPKRRSVWTVRSWASSRMTMLYLMIGISPIPRKTSWLKKNYTFVVLLIQTSYVMHITKKILTEQLLNVDWSITSFLVPHLLECKSHLSISRTPKTYCIKFYFHIYIYMEYKT